MAHYAGETNVDWLASMTQRLNPGWRPGEWDPLRMRFLGNSDNPSTWVFHCIRVGCDGFSQGSGCYCSSCASRRNSLGRPVDFAENYARYAPTRRYANRDKVRTFDLATLMTLAENPRLCSSKFPTLWRWSA